MKRCGALAVLGALLVGLAGCDFSTLLGLGGITGLETSTIRTLQVGDSWTYNKRVETSLGDTGTSETSTEIVTVTDETVTDLAGNTARVVEGTTTMTLDQTQAIVQSAANYISQDADGAIYLHGSRNTTDENVSERFVQLPASGRVLQLDSPLTIGATVEWDVTFDDGVREQGTQRIVSVGEVTVPAGTFTAVEVLGTKVYETASVSFQISTLSWFVPELGRSVKSIITWIPIGEVDGGNSTQRVVRELTATNITP